MKPFFFSLKQKWGVWTMKMWENCMCFSCFVWFCLSGFFFFQQSRKPYRLSSIFFFFTRYLGHRSFTSKGSFATNFAIFTHTQWAGEGMRAESKHTIHLCFLYFSYTQSAGNLIQYFTAGTFWPPVTHEIKCGMFHPQRHVSAQKLEKLKHFRS